MCAILGIFNHPQAVQQVKKAIGLLQHRGRDCFGLATESGVIHHKDFQKLPSLQARHALGHCLHAVVDYVPQPLKHKGILVANCEIYNWKELAAKYKFNVDNDADFLLHFLDELGTDQIEELDGVFAFAYWRDNTLFLARDLLGEKPLCYAHHHDNFAFASEKKALLELGYLDVQELNPRHILQYNVAANTSTTTVRPFFNYLPEHSESYDELKKKTQKLLEKAIGKRVPEKKFGVLFSGGADSTYIARVLQQLGQEFTCYTAVLETASTPAPDLAAAERAAKELGLKLNVKKVPLDKIPSYLKKVVPLIEDSNPVKVGVALTFFVACELAQQDGCKVIFSGLGSEEIFAGYERHKQSANINQECVSGLLKMYERDLYRDDVITMHHGLELRLPFLDKELVKYALRIPGEHKLREEGGKFMLREIALEAGLPREIAFRKKTAAQYGSRFDYALGKLAKQQKFPSKAAYLRSFYPAANLRLGVLFSGGKDSTYAAYIMQRMNYELTCLITVKSKNPDSYMFHTPAIDLTKLQAEAMGMPLVMQKTTGEKETELEDLEQALRTAKEQHQIDGIVTGALFSTYQRDRVERIADKVGLKIFAPLWHKEQEEEMQELLDHHFTFIFTLVAGEGLDSSWLNKVITPPNLQKLAELHKKYKLNQAGEGGEFESLVLDCPLFRRKLVIEEAGIVEEGKLRARLAVSKASLQYKSSI